MVDLICKEGFALGLEIETLEIGKADLKHLFGGVDKFLEHYRKI